jgi:hypothetical protein
MNFNISANVPVVAGPIVEITASTKTYLVFNFIVYSSNCTTCQNLITKGENKSGL